MKKLLIATTLLLGFISMAYSQTYISGGIYTNTTWTSVNSPYIVTGNVVVMADINLSIEQGVRVEFNPGTNLEVRGNLTAIGSAIDTVVFTSSSATPSMGSWGGITFWNNLYLQYVKIEYAATALSNPYSKDFNITATRVCYSNKGLDFMGASSTNTGRISLSKFDHNGTAIGSTNHGAFIANTIFANNNIGIGYVYDTMISQCTFTGHTDKAIDGYGASYIENTFTGNNVALRIKLFNISAYHIRYNIIANNQVGVQARGDGTSTPNLNFMNNTICSNTIYNVQNTDNINLYMKDNCWCTMDSIAIADKIYDGYDNISLGVVQYSPFKSNCSGTGINETDATGVSIYPNPFDTEAVIETDHRFSGAVLTVYNALGEQVKQLQNVSGNKFIINRDGLENGVYLVRIEEGEAVVTARLVAGGR